MILKKNNIDWLTIVTHDYNGGAEQTQRNLIYHLVGEGKKCAVIIIRKKDYGYWENLEGKCHIVYFPFSSHIIGFLCLIPYLTWFVLRTKVSYIFVSQTLINGLLGAFKRLGSLKSTKVIIRESTSIFNRELGGPINRLKYYFAIKVGYSSADLVVCQTNYMKNQLIKEIPWLIKKVKVSVISNPINHKEIIEKSKEIIFNLENETFIVTAGRLIPEKGYDILIDSFFKICTKLKNCNLYILGGGPEENKIKEQIKSLGLENRVILKGQVSNVYPYFKHAKLCVVSSRIEGFPNVLLQMMSQNDRVVSTLSAGDIDKIPGIYTCPVQDVEKLAATVLECYSLKNNGSQRILFDDYLSTRRLDFFTNTMIEELKV